MPTPFMHTRRRFALLAALLLAPLPLVAAPCLTIDSVQMQAGATTNLPVRLSGGTGYGGVGVTLLFPPGLSCLGIERGPALPAGTFDLFYTVHAEGWQSRVSVLAVSSSNTITSTGILWQLVIRADTQMPPGSYAVSFAADDPDGDVHACHAIANADGSLSVNHGQTVGTADILLPPTPGDVNGNGIADSWEIQYFGTLTNVTATTDADGDGLTDYYEYRSGTDPRNAASALAVAGLSPPTAGGAAVLAWYSISGRTYRLKRTDDGTPLTAGWITIAPAVAATPPLNVYTDAVPAATGPRFYTIDSPR